MAEEYIGVDMNFVDINKVLKDEGFGRCRRGWGDGQWNLLINYVSGGIEFADEDWNSHICRRFGP